MKLANKVALVTGGARGLGRAYVLHLAQLGADVVVNDVDLDAARAYRRTAHRRHRRWRSRGFRSPAPSQSRPTSPHKAAVEAMLRQTVGAFGQIDILVNNAGGMLYPPPDHSAATAPPDHYRYILDINLTGAIYCCQAAAPHMQAARSGKIVNVASQAGLWSGRDGGGMAYKVAKAGVIQYTRVLAAELGPYNIHVNCIAPGFHALLPRRRPGPQPAANPRSTSCRIFPSAASACPKTAPKSSNSSVTDLSDYVTGQCIPVCGGYVAF